jgi:outer membrane protein assembly factor BamE (lipoprotein component of BamABCDE complex)
MALEQRLSIGKSAGWETKGPPAAPSADSSDIRNWRSIKPGMGRDQVRALLGEPRKVSHSVVWEEWRYAKSEFYALVRFNRNGVCAWEEPKD